MSATRLPPCCVASRTGPRCRRTRRRSFERCFGAASRRTGSSACTISATRASKSTSCLPRRRAVSPTVSRPQSRWRERAHGRVAVLALVALAATLGARYVSPPSAAPEMRARSPRPEQLDQSTSLFHPMGASSCSWRPAMGGLDSGCGRSMRVSAQPLVGTEGASCLLVARQPFLGFLRVASWSE